MCSSSPSMQIEPIDGQKIRTYLEIVSGLGDDGRYIILGTIYECYNNIIILISGDHIFRSRRHMRTFTRHWFSYDAQFVYVRIKDVLLSRKRVGDLGSSFLCSLDPRLNVRTHPRFYFTPDFTHNTRFIRPTSTTTIYIYII